MALGVQRCNYLRKDMQVPMFDNFIHFDMHCKGKQNVLFKKKIAGVLYQCYVGTFWKRNVLVLIRHELAHYLYLQLVFREIR